jgi:cobalamin biosynthesis protein CobT
MGMNDTATYYGEHEAEDAMSVLARWIGRDKNVQVVYHNGTAVDADIYKRIIRIPRMACASGITQEALMLLRGRVYHEAGHIDETSLTKADYPKGALHEIWNALEDRRMEAVESSRHKGCAVVFHWNTHYYNRKIAEQMSSGKDAPLWEALCAMSFMVEGIQPAWHLGRKAQDYVDAAHSEFIKVKQCKNANEALDLAKVIYKLLKDVNDEWKQNQPPPQEQKKQQGEQGEQGEQGGEPQSGGSNDFDDYENQKPEKGDDKKSGDKGDDSDEGKDKGDGEGADDAGEGDSGEGEGENGEGSEGDSEDDGPDGSKGGKESKNGGKSNKSKPDSENGEDGDGEPNGSMKAGGDVPYVPKNDEPKGGKGDGKDHRDLEDEFDGLSREQAQNEDLEEFFKNLPSGDKKYLSRRDLDRHSAPKTSESDKTSYRERLSQMSVTVTSMTRALEQALRSLSKCRKNPYLRQGKIDHQRLVAIAKNLSRDVFYRTRDGMKLDVAVAITIDESGSMCNFYEVQLLAMAIGEALNSIGIPFEIIGTTTAYASGSRDMPKMDGFTRVNPIVYNHYKLFSEKWVNVRHRMVHTGCHHHNIDGEVVEYAAFRLKQRPERRKVIFSLSDGEPCAGHGNDEEMCDNLKRVCKRVRKEGIEVYGFGVQTESPRAFYGKEWFINLEKVNEIGPGFVREFTRIVTEGKVRV